jgi:hypothetical protein
VADAGARQRAAVGNEVEVLAHLQLRAVDRVVGAAAAAAEERRDADPRQILGIDLVGVPVVGGGQCRGTAAQARQRQPLVEDDV